MLPSTPNLNYQTLKQPISYPIHLSRLSVVRTVHPHKLKLSQQTLLKFFQHIQQKRSRPDPLSLVGFCGLTSAEFLSQHVQCSQFPNIAILALWDTRRTFVLEQRLLYQLCYRKSVFPGLFVTDFLLWLWLAIRCFYLNKFLPQVFLKMFCSEVPLTETKWGIYTYLISGICSNTWINQSLNCDFRVGSTGSKPAEGILKEKISVSEHLSFVPDVCSPSSQVYATSVRCLRLLLKGEPQKDMICCIEGRSPYVQICWKNCVFAFLDSCFLTCPFQWVLTQHFGASADKGMSKDFRVVSSILAFWLAVHFGLLVYYICNPIPCMPS